MPMLQSKPERTTARSTTEAKATAGSAIQRKVEGGSYDAQAAALSPAGGTGYDGQRAGLAPSVQMKGGGGAADVHGVAQAGVSGGGSQLPHLDAIQMSFGKHDVSGVSAHTGGQAAEACGTLGAEAYATGSNVAFKGTPSLHTAAHEAAHVVQQRAGVQLKGGVGKVGDAYERHADAVADRVVQGKSAEGLLSTMAGGGGGAGVQFTGHRLDQALPEAAPTPGHSGGREATDQRQYTVEQYVEMWEKERGRKMTKEEEKHLARGCIGITVINIHDAVNPPLDNAYATFDQAMAVVKEWNAFVEKNKDKDAGNGLKVGDMKAVLFAKLFWSNQKWDHSKSEKENREAVSKKDPNAFPTDAKTGKVDMTGYEYMGQPRFDTDAEGNRVDNGAWYINFDYGFWDEESNCFWHANHSQPGMKVYQSTKERFARGYIDFDRIIYCVAWARNYKPEVAARNH